MLVRLNRLYLSTHRILLSSLVLQRGHICLTESNTELDMQDIERLSVLVWLVLRLNHRLDLNSYQNH